MTKGLFNKNIVISGSSEHQSAAIGILREHGASIIYFPTIKIVPVSDYGEFDSVIKRKKYDYLVFTSVNGVKYFSERIRDINFRFDYQFKTVALGEKTASECEKAGYTVDILPEKYSAIGILNHFLNIDINGKEFLIPGSALSRKELSLGLSGMGAEVDLIPVYDVIPPDDREIQRIRSLIVQKNIDLYIYTSPSAFNNFLDLMTVDDPVGYFAGAAIAVIGPTTRAAIENTGLNVDIEPDVYTLEGIAECVIEYFNK